jgi:uncharacterized membrane protein YkgB
VPLSEHEQRLLMQMEQQLLAEDPKFASAMNGRRSVVRRRMALGVVAVLAGLVTLVLAVANAIVLLGVLAFLVMLAGAVYALSAPKAHRGPIGVVDASGRAHPAARGGRPPRSGTFMQRLEHRWDRRRDDRWH